MNLALRRFLRNPTKATTTVLRRLVFVMCVGLSGLILAGYIALTLTTHKNAIAWMHSGAATVARTTAQYAQLVAEAHHLPPMGEQFLESKTPSATDAAGESMSQYLRRLAPEPDMRILLRQVQGATPEDRQKAFLSSRPHELNSKNIIIEDATSENGRIAAMVLVPSGDALPEWRSMATITGLGVLVVCGFIAFFGYILTLQLHRRDRIEMKLLRSLEEAKSANSAKSDLLANMSHELRTPLNAIIGFSEMMKGEYLGSIGCARYREYADDIFTSGTHLLSLINNLLDISKAASNHLQLHKELISLNFEVAQCLNLISPLAEKGKIQIIAEIDPSYPSLLADKVRLKQILFNLLSNAIKFTPENGEVRVAVFHDEMEAGISVADTGIGMTEEQIKVALTRYGQIDNKLSRKQHGTGLGLPLAMELTRLHGGSLNIRSDPGAGTAITLSLPKHMMIGQAAA
jgi:signal transduction histidine kinase